MMVPVLCLYLFSGKKTWEIEWEKKSVMKYVLKFVFSGENPRKESIF